MPDPNLANFSQRVSRISSAHARGEGFAAEGTLSWKESRPAFIRHQKRPWARVVLYAVLFIIALKILAVAGLTVEGYQSRVDEVLTGPLDNLLLRTAFATGPIIDDLGMMLRHAFPH